MSQPMYGPAHDFGIITYAQMPPLTPMLAEPAGLEY